MHFLRFLISGQLDVADQMGTPINCRGSLVFELTLLIEVCIGSDWTFIIRQLANV